MGHRTSVRSAAEGEEGRRVAVEKRTKNEKNIFISLIFFPRKRRKRKRKKREREKLKAKRLDF